MPSKRLTWSNWAVGMVLSVYAAAISLLAKFNDHNRPNVKPSFRSKRRSGIALENPDCLKCYTIFTNQRYNQSACIVDDDHSAIWRHVIDCPKNKHFQSASASSYCCSIVDQRSCARNKAVCRTTSFAALYCCRTVACLKRFGLTCHLKRDTSLPSRYSWSLRFNLSKVRIKVKCITSC